MALDHERLDVYQATLELLPLALRVAARFPRGELELRDQLRRAVLSIPLNIAEGSGKTGAADRARYYGTARGSAMECAALFDVSHICGYITREEHAAGKLLLERIVSMLSKMARA